MPVTLFDGSRVWFDTYYKKYSRWHSSYPSDDHREGHIDFVENVPEDVYLVRKLSETL